LLVLDLSNNMITDALLKQIALALPSFANLEKLNLSGNKFSSCGGLETLLFLAKSIRSLDLSNNINLTTLEPLYSTVLPQLSNLEELNMSANYLLGATLKEPFSAVSAKDVEQPKLSNKLCKLNAINVKNSMSFQLIMQQLAHLTELEELRIYCRAGSRLSAHLKSRGWADDDDNNNNSNECTKQQDKEMIHQLTRTVVNKLDKLKLLQCDLPPKYVKYIKKHKPQLKLLVKENL